MRVILIVDLEGATGIDNSRRGWFQCGSPEWEEYGRDTITADVLAILKACQKAGVEHVDIFDVHDQGNSIRVEKVKEIYPDSNIWSQIWNSSLDRDYDYAILVGFHAMNQSSGVIPHSFRLDIENIRVNGKSMGEVELFIGLLQEHQIKTIMITGDYHGVKEGIDISLGMVGAVVKRDMGESTHLLSREEANLLLAAKTKEALAKAAKISEYELQPPLNVQMRVMNSDYLEGFGDLPGIWIENGDIRWINSTYKDFFNMFSELIDLLNKELKKSIMINRRFFAKIWEEYTELNERAKEIEQAMREKGLYKRKIFYCQKDRDECMKIIEKF